ncbi:MAG TPA: DUF6624 domain-containing protein [Gemmatimonadales bacterium]|nr:DUF6624 domain-containing protein [Gemmatimonadales bacterium]
MPGHVRALACLGALLLAAPTARAQVAAVPSDSGFRAALLRMRAEDQDGRERVAQAVASGDTLFIKALMARDTALTRRLQALVALHGWPTRATVGEDGVEAAWLVLQHSPDLAWQQEMLPRIWEASRTGDVRPAEAAMLEDRIRTNSGVPQRYGNSFQVVDGELRPHPIEDIDGLEARRREVGLPPMAEYVKVLAEVYQLPVAWPPRPAPQR